MSKNFTGKTLRNVYKNKLENLNKHIKHTDSRMRYEKFNFEFNYPCEETNHGDIFYFSDFEKKLNLYRNVMDDNDLNKFSLKTLKKFLEENNKIKTKVYSKHNSMVKYYYGLSITNKITINNSDKIFIENITLEETGDILIFYVLNIYIYSKNNYTNDGIDINRDAMGCSPDWFEMTHSKNNNYKKKKKNKKVDIHEIDFKNIDEIDINEIENN